MNKLATCSVVAGCLWALSPAYATDFESSGHSDDGYFYKGRTTSGAEYSIAHDGLAELSIGGGQPEGRGEIWKISCDVDAMTDRKSCEVRWDAPLMVRFHLNAAMQVDSLCVTNTVLMAKPALFRVAQGKPMSTSRNGCVSGSTARAIFAKLGPGADVRARTFHYDEGGVNIVDAEATVTEHFAEAFDLARFLASGGIQKLKWNKG